jgi:ABC-type uncharacterized transport system permease subunit
MVIGMSDSGILAIGVGCALVCAVIAWLLLSKTRHGRRMDRIGIEPDADLESLTDEQRDALWQYMDGGTVIAFIIPCFGLAAFFLITYVWSDFPWVVMAACFGWSAWMLNERRKQACT